MMKEGYKITAAEREVVEVLWEYTEPVQTRELLDRMREKGKEWKRQTLNTLLFRLEEKGVIVRRRAYVWSVLSKEELLKKQTEGILNDFYDGDLKNFCAALIGNTNSALNEEEVAQLNALIDKLKDE